MGLFLQARIFSLHKTLINGLHVMLLSAVLYSHSDGTHSLQMINTSKSFLMKKHEFTSWMTKGEEIFSKL